MADLAAITKQLEDAEKTYKDALNVELDKIVNMKKVGIPLSKKIVRDMVLNDGDLKKWRETDKKLNIMRQMNKKIKRLSDIQKLKNDYPSLFGSALAGAGRRKKSTWNHVVKRVIQNMGGLSGLSKSQRKRKFTEAIRKAKKIYHHKRGSGLVYV